MNILNDIYTRSLHENEKNITFWENYLHRLNDLDFNIYSEKLKVPILVPIGNKILFRGDIKHTNEVTVALGADYFAKCSIKQAEVLRLHRIKDAKSKLDEYKKEKQYLESQMSFGKENLNENTNKDIIEVCSEEEDKIWRQRHREKVRQYYQNKEKKQEIVITEKTDEELWNRLEELELQEELENELEDVEKQDTEDQSDENSYDSFIIKEDDVGDIEMKDVQENAHITHNIPKQTSKINLLQQIMDRQKMLENKIDEIKNRQRPQSRDENDLLERLDEMEQMDELEDEMDRLDVIIQGSDSEDEGSEHDNDHIVPKIKRSVSFSDADKCEILQITFQHSDVEPCKKKYDAARGIRKPSDIYKAYPNLFAKEKASILKKSKYEIDFNIENNNYMQQQPQANAPMIENCVNRAFYMKDVKEKTDEDVKEEKNENRPVSLFKLRRQQQKK